MEKINWGIMATGKIARSFATAVNSVEGACFYAIASRTLNKAEQFAKEYNAKKAYGSYKALVQDENIDVVYIATPMSSHYEDVKLCLNNRKNVLCEKSVTLNAKQLEELIILAKEKQLFFMEAMWMKCFPAFKKGLQWAKEGKLGDIQMIKADFTKMIPYNCNDRLFVKELGGGVILDLGVYPITFASAFLGLEPEEITANAIFGQSGVDFDDSVLLNYGNAFASLTFGFDIEQKNNATIIGNKGRIVFDETFLCTGDVTLYDDMANIVEQCHYERSCNGYEYEIAEVQDCLNNGLKESPLIPLKDTLGVMKIMDKCRELWNFKYEEEN